MSNRADLREEVYHELGEISRPPNQALVNTYLNRAIRKYNETRPPMVPGVSSADLSASFKAREKNRVMLELFGTGAKKNVPLSRSLFPEIRDENRRHAPPPER